jgi:plasmid stabilization system protein ParE
MQKNNYQIKFTPIANEDLEGIYLYISKNLVSPKAASDLMDNIETSIMKLKDFPYLGSPVTDDILSSRG